MRMALAGCPGKVTIQVRDEAEALKGDSLQLEMRAGPPTTLAVDGPATLECATRACLQQLRVKACDCFGNLTDASFEVGIA